MCSSGHLLCPNDRFIYELHVVHSLLWAFTPIRDTNTTLHVEIIDVFWFLQVLSRVLLESDRGTGESLVPKQKNKMEEADVGTAAGQAGAVWFIQGLRGLRVRLQWFRWWPFNQREQLPHLSRSAMRNVRSSVDSLHAPVLGRLYMKSVF